MVDTKLTKSAGEHHVCAVLSRLGWGAALTRDGLERTDILAVSTGEHRRVIEVQVKAANGSGPKTSWLLGAKSQLVALSDAEWFVLVALPPDPVEPPRSFVVPRNVVAATAWIVHQNWLTDPSAEPGKRNVGVDRARIPLPYWEAYENRWDLLDGSAYDAPVLLPRSVRAGRPYSIESAYRPVTPGTITYPTGNSRCSPRLPGLHRSESLRRAQAARVTKVCNRGPVTRRRARIVVAISKGSQRPRIAR